MAKQDKELNITAETDVTEQLRTEDEFNRELNRRVTEALALERAGKTVRLPVAGAVVLTLVDGDGNKKQARYGFKDGVPSVRIDGNVVGSAALLSLANGKLSEEDKSAWPYLAKLTQEKALSILTTWVSKGSGVLEPREA